MKIRGNPELVKLYRNLLIEIAGKSNVKRSGLVVELFKRHKYAHYRTIGNYRPVKRMYRLGKPIDCHGWIKIWVEDRKQLVETFAHELGHHHDYLKHGLVWSLVPRGKEKRAIRYADRLLKRLEN